MPGVSALIGMNLGQALASAANRLPVKILR
jgi:hypothetical protein